ncbi:hypothetical protein MAHJHV63_50920 [Mycobacterium avium subsp. hominissuis]
MLADALGLPVSVASHVDAMAGAELLLGRNRRMPSSSSAPAMASTWEATDTGRPSASASLYVYARETVGYALVIGGRRPPRPRR